MAFDRTANYGKSYVAHKIGSKDFCDKISDHPGHMNAKLENLRGSERTRFSGGMCVYTTIEDPKGETVSVEIEGRDVPNAAIPHLLQVITLKDGIRDRKLAAGTARPLSWLPLPIIGCTLVSSRAEWTCFFEFWRNTANLGAIDASGDLTAKVVARALGFKPRR